MKLSDAMRLDAEGFAVPSIAATAAEWLLEKLASSEALVEALKASLRPASPPATATPDNDYTARLAASEAMQRARGMQWDRPHREGSDND